MAMFLARIKRALNLGTKSITANGTYTASSDGYDGYSQVSVAVPDPPSITPSNVSPIAITANSSVKFSRDGYAIQSYSSKTPDDSNPPSVSSGSIIKVSSYSGYLYKTQQASATVKHYTTNVTFNDNTSYVYIATGKFLGFELNRGPVAATPSVQVYIKVGNTYTAVSRVVATLNGTICGAISSESTPTQGDIYMKKTNGSTFTTTSLDVEYL